MKNRATLLPSLDVVAEPGFPCSVYSIPFTGLLGLSAAVVALGLGGLGWAERKSGATATDVGSRIATATLVVLLWAALCRWLAVSGILADFSARPPRLVVLLGVMVVAALAIAFGRIGDKLAQLPFAALVGFQAFRLPLELVMREAASEGLMPIQMSFAGNNFDVLTGLAAIIVAALCSVDRAPRPLIWAFNLLGTLLLLGIMAIAVASTPVFAAYGTGPEKLNTWVAHFPYVYLPTILVMSALIGHLVLWRKLLGRFSRANS